MLWEELDTDPRKKSLALALIERVPALGWRAETLSAASLVALSDSKKWQQIFPGGSQDAIWYISEVSDASMKFPFLGRPASAMSVVIITRLDQNGHLKPFVRKVMRFDIFHPVQAWSRMQRTARAMFECLSTDNAERSLLSITTLNILYTAIVFIWLFDRTEEDAITKWITRHSMRLIGLS